MGKPLMSNSDQQIMAKHTKAILPQLESKTADRDCFLDPQDIRNMNLKLAQLTWKLHDNEAQSVRLFYQQHSEFAFIYQEQRDSRSVSQPAVRQTVTQLGAKQSFSQPAVRQSLKQSM
ncbi:TPA: hypothetical protein ACH3X2_005658 [Trebouxia sp. C0005]